MSLSRQLSRRLRNDVIGGRLCENRKWPLSPLARKILLLKRTSVSRVGSIYLTSACPKKNCTASLDGDAEATFSNLQKAPYSIIYIRCVVFRRLSSEDSVGTSAAFFGEKFLENGANFPRQLSRAYPLFTSPLRPLIFPQRLCAPRRSARARSCYPGARTCVESRVCATEDVLQRPIIGAVTPRTGAYFMHRGVA